MIVGWLHRLPSFGAKVTWLLTLTGGLAVLVVSVGLVLNSYLEQRSELFGVHGLREHDDIVRHVQAMGPTHVTAHDDAQG